jgi:glycosyltransferase involved in cell wall biosynthesis
MSSQVQSNKKVLIVAYYWPPSGGSGVQRWLKFVKYLPQFGFVPYVFTPANPSFAAQDESLMKDVPSEAKIVHFPIWEPYEVFFKLSEIFGKKKSRKPSELVKVTQQSFFEKVSTWVRGNVFVPDPRRFWVTPSVKFLSQYLQENKIETIVTTGPPHSIHLIGYRLKKRNPRLKWIADFRDPWSGWGLLDSLKVSDVIRRLHRKLEFKVLSTADIVTTITPFFVDHFEKLGGRKVDLLTNGYDEDDFKDVKITRSEKFTMRHIGVVNEKCDPKPLMIALKELINENQDFAADVRIEFIGEVNAGFRSFVESIATLNEVTFFRPSVPHKQLLMMYGSSSLLLLVLTGYKDAAGYMPGKLFEYLATGLPILGVGPVSGDASALLKAANAGEMFDDNNDQGIKAFVLSVYRLWKHSEANPERHANEQYSRKALTSVLADLMK